MPLASAVSTRSGAGNRAARSHPINLISSESTRWLRKSSTLTSRPSILPRSETARRSAAAPAPAGTSLIAPGYRTGPAVPSPAHGLELSCRPGGTTPGTHDPGPPGAPVPRDAHRPEVHRPVAAPRLDGPERPDHGGERQPGDPRVVPTLAGCRGPGGFRSRRGREGRVLRRLLPSEDHVDHCAEPRPRREVRRHRPRRPRRVEDR